MTEIARALSVQVGPIDQNRNPFTGMISANPCRVIAMISRDTQQIARAQFGQKRAQGRVKPFEVAGIA